jgi:hypothetical protein
MRWVQLEHLLIAFIYSLVVKKRRLHCIGSNRLLSQSHYGMIPELRGNILGPSDFGCDSRSYKASRNERARATFNNEGRLDTVQELLVANAMAAFPM